jgi:hypothetical protein
VTVKTNEHKSGILTKQKFILSESWRPEVQNQFYWATVKLMAGLCCPEGSRKESSSSSGLPNLPWFMARIILISVFVVTWLFPLCVYQISFCHTSDDI